MAQTAQALRDASNMKSTGLRVPHRGFSSVHAAGFAALLATLVAASPAAAANCPNLTGTVTSTQTVSNGSSCTVAAGAILDIDSGNSQAVTLSSGTGGSTTTLTNNGTIEVTAGGSSSGRAVQSAGTNAVLVIQNNLGATISSINNDTIAAGTGSTSVSSVTLTNAGTIVSAAGGQAVNFNKIVNGATNSVINSGLIKATGSDAVRPGVNGTVSNTGTILAIAVSGSSSDGVDAQNNSGVQITNSVVSGSAGLIEGGRHGITGGALNSTVNFSMSVTNNAGATIQGDNGSGINIDGFNANELVTILNRGTIIGNGVTGDGDGVDVDGLVNLTNSGIIKSLNSYSATGIEYSEGVTVGGGTINNTGTIEGSVAAGNTSALGRGITIAGVDKDANDNPIPVQAPYAATTITNSGLIKGDSDSAIIFSSALASGFSHSITNEAGGVIQTGSTTAAAILTAADNVTITNSGTIDGSSSGKAIVGGSGNLAVNVLGGSAVINGDMTGGAGASNTLTVDPGTGNSFAYSGSISNFNTVETKSGSVSLSGVSTYTGTTRVSGGVLTLVGVNRLSSASSLALNGGTLALSGVGAANGQTFSSLALTDNSSIDLDLSSITFNGLGTLSAGKSLSVIDWSANSSPTYAIRFLGDDTSNSSFLALMADTTIDGTAATITFDGTYTDVAAAVPLPLTLPMLASGLGFLGVWGRRKRAVV